MKKEYQYGKVILGLMRIEKLDTEELYNLIKGCFELGIHYFDISDIYLNNEAERKLGRVIALHPEIRDEMFIQTKCGIIKKDGKATMDLSYTHIKEALYASLERMNLTYVDSFLLHRVDIFMDNEEVAKAFQELYEEGKVKYFGVSNMDKEIIEYLSDALKLPIEVDQLQLSLGQAALISDAFNTNCVIQHPNNLSSGLFFYLKRKHITLQCWSSYQYGHFQGSIFNKEKYPVLNAKLDELAVKYNATPCMIATAFLTMLTKDCQIIVGSTNLEHIKESVKGSTLILSKDDWYDLYCATGNILP